MPLPKFGGGSLLSRERRRKIKEVNNATISDRIRYGTEDKVGAGSERGGARLIGNSGQMKLKGKFQEIGPLKRKKRRWWDSEERRIQVQKNPLQQNRTFQAAAKETLR